MPYWDKDAVEKMMQNVLKSDDTFRFSCKCCGDCCRNRSTPIMLTGLDVFRIAQALEVKTEEVLEKYTRGYLGDDSHLPIFVLKERQDGSCSLLRKGRCTVHANKPVSCAIHPLGRIFMGERTQDIKYFTQQACSNGLYGEVQEWTLKAWLEEFNIDKLESQSKAWNKLLYGIGMVTAPMDKKDISDLMIEAMITAMYLAYNTTMSYEDCVEANIHMISKVFKDVFHIDLNFE